MTCRQNPGVLCAIVVAVLGSCSGPQNEAESATCTKGVLEGSLHVDADADLDYLEGFSAINGDLSLACAGCSEHTDIAEALKCLTAVDGWFYLQLERSTMSLALPALSSVGGDLSISGDRLVELDLSNLTEIGGYLYVLDSTELTSVDLAALSSVGGTVTVRDNQSLTTLGLTGLNWLGGDLDVHDNPVLPYCEICPLIDQSDESEGDIECYGNLEDECWNLGLYCSGASDADSDSDTDMSLET